MALEQWQVELSQCVRSLDQLEQYIPLENKERLRAVIANMRLSITPHSLKLINFNDPSDPLMLICVPQEAELKFSPEELEDPIGDQLKSPIPFLTHRYPDRVLIYATFFCSLFCRFCFRKYKTGEANPGPRPDDITKIEQYLLEHPEVDEAILTGGDPLTLLDTQIEEWLRRLRAVPSINRIRIHTRVPVNLPSRITDNLIEIFKKYMNATHPIYIVTHFNHPREIAGENIEAIAKLVNAGVVIRNQHPLLKGVNDDAKVLAELYKKLVNIRVAPYYLHQLDQAKGIGHFRIPIEHGIELMRALQGTITGIAIPRYMLDQPNGQGKIQLTEPQKSAAEHP
ncbi:MAG: KamA family radical SAM protein [Patescibacteria group bacterium]